ncbi:MAG: NADH-quinone oxidoreductase subunit NuoK [Cyclobacteriaceae bacterium]
MIQYLVYIAALLFCIGITIILVKRNLLFILIGIELALNAVNINLVAFNAIHPNTDGIMFALFVIVIAVCEAAIALGIILQLVKQRGTSNLDAISSLRD